jgi:type II secretory pathway pseudopilin PulG
VADLVTARLRRQDGFTLPELLVGISMGMIVLLATFGLLETVMKRTGETQSRVEATQRGRQTLDFMTRQLRSQSCVDASTPSMIAATPSSVTFVSDLSDGTGGAEKRLEKRTIVYDPAKHTITELTYKSLGVLPVTFAAAPSSKRQLHANVVQDGTEPIFRYFAFVPPTATTPAEASLELTSPTANYYLSRIARIQIAFVSRAGSGATPSPASMSVRDEVYLRSVDPQNPAVYVDTPDLTETGPFPTCI